MHPYDFTYPHILLTLLIWQQTYQIGQFWETRWLEMLKGPWVTKHQVFHRHIHQFGSSSMAEPVTALLSR